MKSKEYVSALLVAALSFRAEKILSNYSKNKMWNSLGAVVGSAVTVEYLRQNNMMPVLGDINLNRTKKSSG